MNDNFILGVDYYINPRHTVSFESKFNNVLSSENNSTIDYLVNEYHNESLVNSHSETQKSDGNGNGNYQSVFYIAQLSDNDKLNLDATISTSNDDSRNDFYENTIFEHTNISDNKQNKFRFNSEFTHNINEKSSFNLGYGFYNLKSQNSFNASNYTLKDNRHKLFGYYAVKPSKKIGVKVGVAGEVSTPELSNKKLTYFIYQPYLDVKYNLSKKVDLKLKYRSNSNYPSLSEANPNTVFIDNETESKGNPNLKPSVTHKISVRSNILGGFLSLEPYYHFSNNYIGQIGKLRSDGIIEYNYDNVGSYRNYGVKGSIAFPLFKKKVFWQTSANYYRSSIVYNGNKNAFNDVHLESNLIYVNRKNALTSGFVFQRGMNKRISTQGFNKSNNDFLGFLVQKGFYKNKLNLMLLYMLPIDGSLDYIQSDYVSTPTFNRTTEYDINLLKNVFVFKLNYRFSKGKSTRKTAKDIQEDEKKKDGFF